METETFLLIEGFDKFLLRPCALPRRRVNLTNELLSQLQAQEGSVWVFSSPKDPQKHRTRQTVWWDVKRAAKAFRLPQNVAPHSLRKLYAVDLLNRCGGNLGRVQRALNHSDAATTYIYAMAYEIYRAKYEKPNRERD